MKKFIHIFAIFFIIFAVFACTLPSTVEIRGTPEITVRGSVTFNEEFQEMFDEIRKGFENQTVDGFQFVECDNQNVKYMTFAMYLPLIGSDELDEINANLSNPSLGAGSIDTALDLSPGLPGEYEIGRDYDLATGNAKDIEINMSDFPEFMNDFELSGIEAYLYVSGSDIVESLGIDVYLDDITFGTAPNVVLPGTPSPDIEISGPTNPPLDWEDSVSNGKYTKYPFPKSDYEVEVQHIINDGETVQFSFRAYLKQGNRFKKEWLNSGDVDIKAELVIWLPLKLKAKVNGAVIEFPNDFGEDDIFGRNKDDDNTLFESIEELTLELTRNTGFELNGLKLRVWNVGDTQPFKIIDMGSNRLKFDFDSDQMKIINETIPFVPRIEFFIPHGKELKVPRDPDFNVTELYFKAKLNYKIEI